MANEAWDNLVQRVDNLEKENAILKAVIDKDRFSDELIMRKNLTVLGKLIADGGVDLGSGDLEFSNATVTFSGTTLDVDVTNFGIFGATPVTQQSDMGTTSLTDVSGTGDDATINSNQAITQEQLNEVRTVLRNLGFMA